ncbi:nuclear transport factor 2 family protein [Thalassomonas sp. M1454]|uniref:nuclear transport factor 2 family protein n=1 Tax=Thalassomonas sp. M1454 TaxID=2594477 RepID=UPI00117EFF97|nr:nuclear transport factor 2 family protein [Thalassomonas sp. M1454]TRX56763.1 nuclear transport factor 2 family protein [Thalassomonas sp. M1454]
MPSLKKDVTQVYWQPLDKLLAPDTARTQSLKGFDDEFIDITDYIIRITHRIWEQKNVGLCFDYYGEICPVYTLGAYSESVDLVVQNTLKTIAAFPDRSLIGENVIWNDEGDDTYYSSHLITSIMTNSGDSEFGPATNKTGRVTTIADCVCKENRIIEEWLVRDNSFLVKQLGIKPIDAAKKVANNAVHPTFTKWYASEYERVINHDHRKDVAKGDEYTNLDEFNAKQFAQSWQQTIFNQKQFSKLVDYYHLNASLQWPGGRNALGVAQISGTIIQWLAQCPDCKLTFDHIGITYFDEHTCDIAVRWALAGTHSPQITELEHTRGDKFFVLGATHLKVHKGKIAKEITVFDEIALMANLLRTQQQSFAHLGGKLDV